MESFKLFDIIAEKEGYIQQTEQVDIDPGETEQITIKLEREPVEFNIGWFLFISVALTGLYMLYEDRYGKNR